LRCRFIATINTTRDAVSAKPYIPQKMGFVKHNPGKAVDYFRAPAVHNTGRAA
jgi:hypothetical protein